MDAIELGNGDTPSLAITECIQHRNFAKVHEASVIRNLVRNIVRNASVPKVLHGSLCVSQSNDSLVWRPVPLCSDEGAWRSTARNNVEARLFSSDWGAS